MGKRLKKIKKKNKKKIKEKLKVQHGSMVWWLCVRLGCWASRVQIPVEPFLFLLNLHGCELLSLNKWSKLIGRYMMLSINIDRGESLSQLQILNLDLSQWKERPLCLLLFDFLICYLVIAYGNFELNKNLLNIGGGLIWGKAYLEVIWYSQPNVDPMFLQFKRWPNFIFFGI